MSIARIIRHKSSLPIGLIVFITFQLYFYRKFNITHLNDFDSITFNLLQVSPFGSVTPTKVYLNDKSYIATPYEKLIEKHGEKFHELTYEQKCSAYFNELYEVDESWDVHDFSNLPYDKSIFETKGHFIQHRVNQFMEKLDPSLSKEEKDKIVEHEKISTLYEVEWQAAVRDAHVLEQKLIDSNTHLRAYGACFLNQYGSFTKATKEKTTGKTDKFTREEKPLECKDIETRMFQWLTHVSPKYTRWNGEVITKGVPVMANYIDIEGPSDPVADLETEKKNIKRADSVLSEPESPEYSCHLKSFRDSLNGRGIVLSAADSHAEQLASLIGLLRALGNKLPIQVVHSGDLSEDVSARLVGIARNVENLNLRKIDFLDHALKLRNLTFTNKFVPSKEDIEALFPKQEIWFVDISNSVTKKYKNKFSGYGNKLLAFFFNSFQHSILVDTDTVPMVKFDDYILKSKFYLEKGAYFFRDRELFSQIKSTDSIFYQKLMPSLMDTAMFGIPAVTDFTLKNRFIAQRFDHYMESGVVAIDKVRHFTGVLTTVQSQLWSPVTSRIWGDKELFWLGLSMSGDEDYFMNYWPAGAVGKVTPREHRLSGDKDDKRRSRLVGNELCATHPAHISSEDNSTLIWFNSGFGYCKNLRSIDDDFKSPLFNTWFESKDDLLKMYTSYDKIESVIIPKGAEFYLKNDKGENTRGWEKGTQCEKFLYCAYDKVGGQDSKESNGILINFDEDTKKLYYFYGSCNVNAVDIFQENELTKVGHH